ncbi:sensor histidine kinase [Haloimpatiens sp. FM7330]|uniref:sensor histidine kinase n=1 Tax=Haloimpatiens sp. FM7330 TaxID=3298610 RepID=UPI003642A6BF
MSFFKYIKDLFWTILHFILVVLIINLILITSVPLSKSIYDLMYMNILIFSISFTFLIAGYIKWKKNYKDLKEALYNGTNIDKYVPEGDKLEQYLIRKIINCKNHEMTKNSRKLKEDLEEINDYMAKWVHQIKIPISVCELIADKIEQEENMYTASEELRVELERIKFLINQVLYTSRASNYSEDFTVEEMNLQRLVKSVVKNNATFFINKKIELEINDLDFNVFTDKKWISYILDQIINNACKYVSENGKIQIYAKEDEESIRLLIRDDGLGIPNKDIQRIFDKGFTGDNGRKTTKSTGMGLYIVKKMISKLNHKIEVSSQVSQYTEFTIVFYKICDYLNVT